MVIQNKLIGQTVTIQKIRSNDVTFKVSIDDTVKLYRIGNPSMAMVDPSLLHIPMKSTEFTKNFSHLQRTQHQIQISQLVHRFQLKLFSRHVGVKYYF